MWIKSGVGGLVYMLHVKINRAKYTTEKVNIDNLSRLRFFERVVSSPSDPSCPICALPKKCAGQYSLGYLWHVHSPVLE